MKVSNRRAVSLSGLAVLAAGGVLGLALTVPGAAFAEPAPSPSSSAPAGPSSSGSASAPDDRRAERQSELAADLAAELGIEESKVAAALEKVREKRVAEARTQRTAELKTRLDAAVTAGTLTREQADAILKAAEAGVLPGGSGAGRGHGGGHPRR